MPPSDAANVCCAETAGRVSFVASRQRAEPGRSATGGGSSEVKTERLSVAARRRDLPLELGTLTYDEAIAAAGLNDLMLGPKVSLPPMVGSQRVQVDDPYMVAACTDAAWRNHRSFARRFGAAFAGPNKWFGAGMRHYVRRAIDQRPSVNSYDASVNPRANVRRCDRRQGAEIAMGRKACAGETNATHSSSVAAQRGIR